MWQFWGRHRRKVFVSLGVLGSGYFLYKLYDAHRRRLSDMEMELANERQIDEVLKAQIQKHFEGIQTISDTMTLPDAMFKLSSRVAEELDLLQLTEQLMKGKGQLSTLTSAQKLELWDRLKILSFTRTALSIWATTMLSLYIRVLVNILGRHLYIDTVRGLGRFHQLQEEGAVLDDNDEQQFLASADYLSDYSIPTLISNMQAAATEVLKGKHLKDLFNASALNETIMQILDVFMSMGSPHPWLEYLMPEDARLPKYVTGSTKNDADLPDITRFDQLMFETREVLSSVEFGNIVEIAVKNVVEALMEDIKGQVGEANLSSGMPLAKLMPRVAQLSPLLLEEPSKNRFINIIRNTPEVELFFTLLYANMPAS